MTAGRDDRDPVQAAFDAYAFRRWLGPVTYGPDRAQLDAAVRAAVRQELTPTQRKYVVMRYADGLKLREIAAACGVQPPAVCTGLRRARIRLRRYLKQAFPALYAEK